MGANVCGASYFLVVVLYKRTCAPWNRLRNSSGASAHLRPLVWFRRNAMRRVVCSDSTSVIAGSIDLTLCICAVDGWLEQILVALRTQKVWNRVPPVRPFS